MREFRFRAWDVEQKKMFRVDKMRWILFGSPEELQGVSVTDGQNFYHSGRGHMLMQYTGLKDKNGVEIYEGDIYTMYSEMNGANVGRYVVEWKRGGFGPLPDERYIEVIGNIYKNPELLNKNEE